MGIIARIICGILVALSAHVYGMNSYVAEVDEDMVCFVDFATENEWWAENETGWKLYDEAELVMFDWFTAEKYDDQIITATKVTYAGKYEVRGVTK